jgi:hypothetical protein
MSEKLSIWTKKIISCVKYREFVLKSILREQGYHVHHLYKFLGGCVEANEGEPILKNF